MSADPRSPLLDEVLVLAQRSFEACANRPAGAVPVAGRMFAALREPAGNAQPIAPHTLPVCEHLAVALAAAQRGPAHSIELARAFAALVPRLAWSRRPGTPPGEFHDGHANTWLVGPKGLEQRADVLVGVSLVAPGVRYVDHQHPPEEIYIVLTPGEWRHAAGPWHEPGVGGVVHNPPNIVHAMRAGETPLLALWMLWNGRS